MKSIFTCGAVAAAIAASSAQAATVTETTTGWAYVDIRDKWCGSSNCGEDAYVGFYFILPIEAKRYTLTVESSGFGLAFLGDVMSEIFYSDRITKYSHDPDYCGYYLQGACYELGWDDDADSYEFDIYTVSGSVTYVASADTQWPDWATDPEYGVSEMDVVTDPIWLSVFNARADEWLSNMTVSVSYEVPAVSLPAAAPLIAGSFGALAIIGMRRRKK
ncbi:VPLPA-CTERM sorting domain-containing protein [Paenirhodobacter populi]|uniref:VPLPA-CTERM sorting domain-containing protein n=1 Tax=Paenirhodobacter populi TaxID=2306993 RepID=A0A443IS12_9RHOB|nr:VPLPA-CTERM sorting domain-containing protein [Sinirhodobacter populi]RWR10449.1 hypothetical protein D2T33_12355 [Sinirhodobacter populi]